MEELTIKYGVNGRTIRWDLESMRYVRKIARYKDVTIQMDIAYLGRDFGLIVIRDALRGNVLWRKYVRHENIVQYVECVDWLKSQCFRI